MSREEEKGRTPLIFFRFFGETTTSNEKNRSVREVLRSKSVFVSGPGLVKETESQPEDPLSLFDLLSERVGNEEKGYEELLPALFFSHPKCGIKPSPLSSPPRPRPLLLLLLHGCCCCCSPPAARPREAEAAAAPPWPSLPLAGSPVLLLRRPRRRRRTTRTGGGGLRGAPPPPRQATTTPGPLLPPLLLLLPHRASRCAPRPSPSGVPTRAWARRWSRRGSPPRPWGEGEEGSRGAGPGCSSSNRCRRAFRPTTTPRSSPGRRRRQR